MDFAVASALALQQVKLQSQVSAHLLRKVLDVEASSEAQLLALVDQSAGIGQTLDTTA